MKKILLVAGVLLLPIQSWAEALPVFSANGFICGKEGSTVTCKGPIPGVGQDTVTGTGRDLVYITINSVVQGTPLRYTYFSDTGCLVGYGFNAANKPITAVASHRNGTKKTFDFNDTNEKYEEVINFCIKENPVGSKTATAKPEGSSTPAKPSAATATEKKTN